MSELDIAALETSSMSSDRLQDYQLVSVRDANNDVLLEYAEKIRDELGDS